MTNLTVFLPLLAFAISCALANPVGNEYTHSIFNFVDATNPAGWKAGKSVQIEMVKLIGNCEDCHVSGYKNEGPVKTMAKFELTKSKKMSWEEFEKMAFEIEYTDLCGTHQVMTVKIEDQSADVRDAIYKGIYRYRMEKVSDGPAKISIDWDSPAAATTLDVIVVEENSNTSNGKLHLEKVYLTQGELGACDPKVAQIRKKENPPKFRLSWKLCGPNFPKGPELLRNVEIHVEYSHEHDHETKHVVVQLEKYPYKKLQKLYTDNWAAKITVNAQNGYAMIDPLGAGAEGACIFTFVDATNPEGWKEGHRVKLEKVRLVGNGQECPVEIWDSKNQAQMYQIENQVKTAGKFELLMNEWKNQVTQDEFENMSFEIAYTDLSGAHHEMTIKINEIPNEEVRDAIYDGGEYLRMEKVAEGKTKISIFWGAADPSALDVTVVEANNANAHAKLHLEKVSVTKGVLGPCETVPINGPAEFHLDWKYNCQLAHMGEEPELFRNVKIRVEYSHEHDKNGGKKHAVVQLEKYPYEVLEQLYEGGNAKITVNAHNGHAVIEPVVEKGVKLYKPASAFCVHNENVQG